VPKVVIWASWIIVISAGISVVVAGAKLLR
jgi:hypothetical protein